MKRPSLLHCDSWSIPIHRVTQSPGRFLDHLLANPIGSFLRTVRGWIPRTVEVGFLEVGVGSRFCIINGVRLLRQSVGPL